MKIAVKNFDNQQVREIDLPEEIFGYPYKAHLIHEAVQAYLSGLRAGTHKVTVAFLNDAWGGTAATDRNLYVDGISHGGVTVDHSVKALMSTGAADFAFV